VTINQRDVLNDWRPMRGSIRVYVSALSVLAVILGANSWAQSLQPQPFPGQTALGRAMAVQAVNQPALLATEGVRGVGIGQVDSNLAIVVLVDSTNTVALLPPSLDGFPVSAQVVGRIHLDSCLGENPQLAYPLPIPLGVSGGNDLTVSISNEVGCASGTIGFKVRDNTNPRVVGWISNAHVAANATNGCPGAPIGTPEYQPGPVDTTPTCSAGQLVGTLNRFVPIDFSGGNSVVDAAFVQSSDADVSSTILNLGPQVNNVVPPFVGQFVQKDGRTTGCTEGMVTAINLAFPIAYDCGSIALYTNNIMIAPLPPAPAMSEAGDSGSPIVDPDNNAVALNYAGDDLGNAYAFPMGAVLSALNVSLASSVGSSQVVTRTSRFWFTHAFNLTDTNCVTLLNAIQANGSVMPLGFATLPTADRNADNVIDAYDTLVEALSFYWRSTGVTGEPGGSQAAKLGASALCVARKKLAVELIAAEANVALFGTFPGNATYGSGQTVTNLPPDLILQAQSVAGGYDPVAINTMTALLRQFNNSGVTNNLPNGLVECSPQTGTIQISPGVKTSLKQISQDPMTQATCPGVNNSCDAAQVIVFPNSSNPFARAVFTTSVNLNAYTNNMPAPTCGSSGPDAVWQITPDIGINGRQFTVNTAGSNFSTMLSVWTGTCGASSNAVSGGSEGLNEVTCAVNSIGLLGATLTFNTDGSNTFFIVGQGPAGQYGKLKLTITSP
jgi:hypothetical protein